MKPEKRPCAGCGRMVTERNSPDAAHKKGCPLVAKWSRKTKEGE